MNLKKYKKEFNDAPFEFDDFAEGATQVVDCPELSESAKQFIAARDAFQAALDKFKIRLG